MMLLLFRAGADRYGIEAARVVEVGPLVDLRPAPGTVPGFLGWCNFRGRVTPVVDLSQVMAGQAARPFLSTRLVFVDLPGPGGRPFRLGLAAEAVTETLQVAPGELQPAGIHLPGVPYLGGVVLDGEGKMIQVIEIEKVLSDGLREALDLEGRSA